MGNLCKLTSLQNPRYKKELRPLKSVNNVGNCRFISCICFCYYMLKINFTAFSGDFLYGYLFNNPEKKGKLSLTNKSVIHFLLPNVLINLDEVTWMKSIYLICILCLYKWRHRHQQWLMIKVISFFLFKSHTYCIFPNSYRALEI